MFLFTGIEQYHQWLQSNPTGCEKAVEHYLKKILDNKRLNAFVEVYQDESLARARYLDNKRSSGTTPGKLHGVIIAIKDVICYKDHRVTAASSILKNFTSLYNSTAVERLLAEDAIIIGSCNCDEFAMGSTNEHSAYGKVLNALDETKVPGGSSGGSAVAVQAELSMVSLGSDTGGSVRQPADFCGIIGFKPSYGRISRHGLIAYASSFDQIGIFGNSVADVMMILDVIQGPDDFDSTALPETTPQPEPKLQPLRIAWFNQALDHPSLNKEIRTGITGLISKLKSDGHQLAGIDFSLWDFIVPTYYVLTTAEASSNLSRYDGVRYGSRQKADTLNEMYTATRSEGFGAEVKRRILLGTYVLSEGYYNAYFTKAQQVRRLLIQQTEEIFKDYDAIIIPTVPQTAFTIGEMQEDRVAMYLADIYTVFANLAGIPAISIPLFKSSINMPFGLQIMTGKNKEVTLLRISELLMNNYK